MNCIAGRREGSENWVRATRDGDQRSGFLLYLLRPLSSMTTTTLSASLLILAQTSLHRSSEVVREARSKESGKMEQPVTALVLNLLPLRNHAFPTDLASLKQLRTRLHVPRQDGAKEIW